MNNAIKKYNRFAADFNKSVEESSKKEHPLPEIIHLYAMNALLPERMRQFEEHLEYCRHCGEILADAEEIQQISEDVEAGVLDVDARIPDFQELKEKVFGKAASKWQPLAEILLEKVRNLVSGEKSKLAYGFGTDDLEKIFYDLADGSQEEIELYEDKENKRIEVYSANESLLGKTIKITTGDKTIEAVFKDRPTSLERKPVKAIIRYGAPDAQDFVIGENTKIEIG